MKKIIYILLIVVMILIISKPRYDLSGDMVRFRVIPNSNSSIDILVKEKVINELSTLLFKDSNDINVILDKYEQDLKNHSNEVKELKKKITTREDRISDLENRLDFANDTIPSPN